MKNFLTATSALVAAAAFAGSAAAAPATPIKLTVGGSSVAYVSYATQDSKFLEAVEGKTGKDGYNGLDVRGDQRIKFAADTTLNNGLTLSVASGIKVGGNAGDTGGETVKLTGWGVTAASSFGSFVVASDSTASDSLLIGSEDYGFKVFGDTTDSDMIKKTIMLPEGVKSVGTGVDMSEKGEGISYYTPALYGVTVGVSYHPDVKVPNVIKANLGDKEVAGKTTDVGSVGAQWKGSFSGLSLGVSGGYTAKLDSVKDAGGNNAWGLGGQVGYAGFTVGGGFKMEEARKDLDAPNAWEVGLGYQAAPYAVSLNYYQSTQPFSKKTDTTKATEHTLSQVQLSGQYALAKGVKLEAAVGYVTAEAAGYKGEAAGPDKDKLKNSGLAVGTGLVLNF